MQKLFSDVFDFRKIKKNDFSKTKSSYYICINKRCNCFAIFSANKILKSRSHEKYFTLLTNSDIFKSSAFYGMSHTKHI